MVYSPTERQKRLSRLRTLQIKMQRLWDGWEKWRDANKELRELAESFRIEFEQLEAEEFKLLADLRRGR